MGRFSSALLENADRPHGGLNGRWIADALTGKRCYGYRTVTGKREHAEAELRKIIDSMECGDYVPPAKSSLGEWIETWLKTYTGDLAARTTETYEFLLRHRVVPYVGSKPLQKAKGW